MFISCPNDGRKIRYLITAILKAGLTTHIKKLNYIKSYELIENKVSKKEENLLRIDKISDTNKLKLILEKLLPESKILE